jgi:phage terminase small subunit
MPRQSSNKRITPKQLKLVEIMLTHENISMTKAGEMVGYSAKTAAQTASRTMALPHVAAYYDEQLAARSARVGVDADYVLRRLTEIDQMDVLDILDDDGKLKPLKEWPKVWRQTISGIDLKTGKIRWPEKLKNIELIGKHIGVRAFAELVEVDVKEGFGERLAAAAAKLAAKS